MPVFSLRSKKSLGVGEFLDLKPLVDLCNKTGLKLIQLLPLNDTSVTKTWVDSYPYRFSSDLSLPKLLFVEDTGTRGSSHRAPDAQAGICNNQLARERPIHESAQQS